MSAEINKDPLTGGQNGVNRKPLGTYRKAKQAALQKMIDSGSDDDFSYTRKQYRADKQAARAEGRAITGLGQALSSETASDVYSGINAAATLAGSFVDKDVTKNPTAYSAQQSVGDLLTQVNPMVGTAYKVLSTVAEATGGNTNIINKEQASNAGLSKSERFFNNVFGVVPGLGWAAKDTSAGQKSHLIDEMSNAYADSVYDIDQAQTLGGSKFLFGRNKIQNSIREANRRNELLTDINMTNTMRKQSDYGLDLAQQNLNRYVGTNYMNMRMGRKGMKIQNLEEIRELLKNRITEELDIQKFADGGSILPTGKLHKERHHIESVSPDLEDVITKKGIPVVTMDEEGSLVAVAEIERDEWTLSKEFTDQIEALWKDGSEEAMIECGKLVCEELLRNTQDSSNILEKEEEDGND